MNETIERLKATVNTRFAEFREHQAKARQFYQVAMESLKDMGTSLDSASESLKDAGALTEQIMKEVDDERVRPTI